MPEPKFWLEMKKTPIFLFIFLTIFLSYSQQENGRVSGIVTDLGQPIANVNIVVQGSDKGTKSDNKGKYSINTAPGDVLVFSYVGMNTMEIIVEDVTKILNIELTPRVEQLEEVVVEKKRKSQIDMREEYSTNKNIIKTSIGYIDKDRVGYSMQVLDGNQLNTAAMDILSAIEGKFANISIRTGINPESGTPERGVYMRGGSATFGQPRAAVYEVDGSIFTSLPSFVAVESIDRLAIIPATSSMARYGNIAAGGLVVINTKEGSRQYAKSEESESRVQSNTAYVSASKFKREPPKYLVELQKSTSKSDALNNYREQKKLYADSPYYFLDVYAYFSRKWKDSMVSLEIQKDLKVVSNKNPNALKALAYLQEDNDNLSQALETYMSILKLRPKYAQSYRDLANIYAENGAFGKALNLYARYEKSRRLDTITTVLNPINSIIRTESKTMAILHGKALNISETVESDLELGQTRLLFEWNNSEAEFVLQFVKPDFSYLTWNHSLQDNPDRIRDEKLNGYSSEQFLIDKGAVGIWFVNSRYFGNKGYYPTYLKATVFHNYGLPSQRKELKVFKLDEKNVNRELFSFVNNPSRDD